MPKPDKPPGKPEKPPGKPPIDLPPGEPPIDSIDPEEPPVPTNPTEKSVTFNVDGPSTVTISVSVTGTGITPPPDGSGETEPPVEPPIEPPIEPPPMGNELEVGPGKQYANPADAYNAAQPGDTITCEDGFYSNPFIQEKAGLTIRSRSGNPYACVFDGKGGEGYGHPLAWHKGMILCRASATIQGIGFVGCGSPQSGDNYSNEAGVYVGDTDGQTEVRVLVRRCAFDDNGNGCFAGAGERNVHIVIEECIYGYHKPNGMNAASGGGGNHAAHDNYLQGGSAEVSGSYFYGTCNGHNIKSRCLQTNVHDNPLLTQDGGRVLDVSDGGEATLRNNTIFTRTDRNDGSGWYGNANMVGYASESANNGTQGLQTSGNTMNVNRNNSKIWAGNGTTVNMSGDTINCYDGGSVTTEGNVRGLPQANMSGGSMPALPPPPSWANPGRKQGQQQGQRR